MKRTKDDYARLIAELESDFADFEVIMTLNLRANERLRAGASDALDYAALGYTIHNLYGTLENYCLRIAKFFENGLDPAAWHKEILLRMTIEVEELRPSLFSKIDLLVLDELRAFRQTFRHLYARPIDPVKVLAVQEKIPLAIDIIRRSHEAFVHQMRLIKTSI